VTNDQINRLRDDLELAAKTLRRYESLHLAKGTPESLEKANANAALAWRFEATLANAPRQGRLSDPENKAAMDSAIAKLQSDPDEAAGFLRDIGFDTESSGSNCRAPAGVHAEPAPSVASLPAELTPPPHDSMEDAQMAAREWPQEAAPATVRVGATAGVHAEQAISNRLLAKIAHGDEEHRAWLKRELDVFFAGVHAEPAGDAGMPVVAYEFEHTYGKSTLHPEEAFTTAYRDTVKAIHQLVRQRDAQAAIAARDARIAELEAESHDALPRSEITAWLSRRLPACGPHGITNLPEFVVEVVRWAEDRRAARRHDDQPYEPTPTQEDRVRMGWSDSDGVAAEYAETYARAQAQAAFWVWHAITHGRAPDMVPQEIMRPSGRVTWLRDNDIMRPSELMTPTELDAAYAASAAEMPQFDHNWRTGQPADSEEVIDAWRRRQLQHQKLDWSESSDAATRAGDL
jgi:hypothetical protein